MQAVAKQPECEVSGCTVAPLLCVSAYAMRFEHCNLCDTCTQSQQQPGRR